MTEDARRILVVDDEAPIRRYLRVVLGAQGYTLLEAASGQEALNAVPAGRPDLIILDLGLPDIDGVEVTRRLREWSQTPIIILSVREAETDKIAALDAGADDYLVKPFGTGELLARIRASLRRQADEATEPILQSGTLRMDLSLRLVTMENREISLTPTEYDLLRVLMRNAGKVITHRHLLRLVWGPVYEDEMHLLRVNVSNLRRKLEPDPSSPSVIRTEPGVGYRLIE
ncbi:MAG: response regulator transcription factor [Anaerolineales bacterium]